MKVLIIEDEKAAFENLELMLKKYDSSIIILAWLTGVQDAVKWFNTNNLPDLVFLDINLSDGLSFDIFKQINLKTPVIFTTAYHEYAIRAFEANSVDYLLKPYEQKHLNQSINKFKEFHSNIDDNLLQNIKQLIEDGESETKKFKKRFLVKSGSKLYSINTNEIAYFFRDELVFLMTFDKTKFIVEYSLDELENILHPKEFFRMNRQVIANVKAIETANIYSKSKLFVKLKPNFHDDVIVSQEKSAQFKKWLDDVF